jgi:hypothetical protein
MSMRMGNVRYSARPSIGSHHRSHRFCLPYGGVGMRSSPCILADLLFTGRGAVYRRSHIVAADAWGETAQRSRRVWCFDLAVNAGRVGSVRLSYSGSRMGAARLGQVA